MKRVRANGLADSRAHGAPVFRSPTTLLQTRVGFDLGYFSSSANWACTWRRACSMTSAFPAIFAPFVRQLALSRMEEGPGCLPCGTRRFFLVGKRLAKRKPPDLKLWDA